jgi:serine/threonine-protein kinase
VALPRPYGRYVLEERIAMGGMAEIFRARMTTAGFEKRVCIKRVLPSFLEDPEFVTMFRDEARTAAKLQHANVVQVFDFGEVEEDSGTTLYLAMEFIDGCDLRRLLDASRKKQLPVSLGEVTQIGIDVCRGLHHAHTLQESGRPLGIVHRDVSPHNVLLSRSGEVKVTDFGIARAAERATHTSTGIVKGKVAYMSPEQAEGRHFDHRLDQWALGVILWELLCGRRLFQGENDIAVMRSVVNHEVPPPSSLRPDLPAALEEIVLRALAASAADRFADLRRMELALQRFLFSGSIDPATADVRAVFPRIIDVNSGPPQPARRTNVLPAEQIVSASLAAAAAFPPPAPAAVPSTRGAPTLLDVDMSQTATGEGGADEGVSVVFTNSGRGRPAPTYVVPGGSSHAPADAVTAVGDNPQQPGAVPRAGRSDAAGDAPVAPEGTPVTRSSVVVHDTVELPQPLGVQFGAALVTQSMPTTTSPGPRRPATIAAAALFATGAAIGGIVALSARPTSSTTELDGGPPPPVATSAVPPAPTTNAPPAPMATTPGADARPTTTNPTTDQPTNPTTNPTTDQPTNPPARATTSPTTSPTTTSSAATTASEGANVAATAETGTVVIDIVGGWGSVFEGGRPLGETPLVLELPAGRHSLTLQSGDGKKKKTVTVVVPAAGRVAVSEAL